MKEKFPIVLRIKNQQFRKQTQTLLGKLKNVNPPLNQNKNILKSQIEQTGKKKLSINKV